MDKIRKVIRADLPETNSSSSHSVVISMNRKNNLKKEDWGLNIDENLILHIPQFIDFDRRFFYSNQPLVKLQYLSCYFVQGYIGDWVLISKLIHKLEVTLRDILGIRGISFDEVVEVWTRIHNKDLTREDAYLYEFPEIDWQSRDLRYEILESPETIRNFLLNPDSWVYGGDDSEEVDPKYYKNTRIQPVAIGRYSAYLKGLGRVDFQITTDNYSLREFWYSDDDFLFRYIAYNAEIDSFFVYDPAEYPTEFFSSELKRHILLFDGIDENNVIHFSSILKDAPTISITGEVIIDEIREFGI